MHLQILQFAEEVAKEKGKPPENKLELVRNCPPLKASCHCL